MKTKKLLFLFTLIIGIFSTKFTLPGQEPNNGISAAAIAAITASVMTACAHLSTIIVNSQTFYQKTRTIENEIKKARLEINNGYLNGISSSDTALSNNATAQKNVSPSVKTETEKNLATIANINEFYRQGKGDKEYFNPNTTYKTEEPKIDTNKTEQPTTEPVKEPTPGLFKKTTAFMAALPLMTTDAIANTLPINAVLKHMAASERFKGGFLDTHQHIIGRAAAAGIMAGVAGIMYKTYTWYTNQDRILAQETVLELEEQQKELTKQFAKEIKKSTLSAEEKAKLQRAYESYMEELEEAIEEQKIAAGYGMSKKLILGALTAATGLTGLTVLAKHYLAKAAQLPEATQPQNTQINTNASSTTPNTETPSSPTPNEQTEAPQSIEAIESTTPQIVEGKKNSFNAGHAAFFVAGVTTVGTGILAVSSLFL
jgi:hypothetical protein